MIGLAWTLALPALGQTNFISIPYQHPGASNWWDVAPESFPDYVTNWQAWQAVNENFRRASNALAAVSGGTNGGGYSPWRPLSEIDPSQHIGIYTMSNPVVIGDWSGSTYITLLPSGEIDATTMNIQKIDMPNFAGQGVLSVRGMITNYNTGSPLQVEGVSIYQGVVTGGFVGPLTGTASAATNVLPPTTGSAGYVLTKTATGVGFSNQVALATLAVGSTNDDLGRKISATYLTGNQTVTLSGDATGSGATAITLTTSNIQPPGASSAGQVLTRTATGVGFSNAPAVLPAGMAYSNNTSLTVTGSMVLAASTNKLQFGAGGASLTADGLGNLVPSGGLQVPGNIVAAGGPAFGFSGNGSGLTNIPAAAIVGLTDTQTNAMLNSFRVPAIVSNSVSISAGATNVLGWVTNLAGIDFTYPNVLVTNSGWWTTNGPLLLFSSDGTNYIPGLASFVTNAAVQVAWYSGSMQSNPPTMQIPLPGVVSNVTAYKLVRPDLFGKTNASFGEIMLTQDPTQPTQVANKEYVDNLFMFTSWWNAQQDIQVNAYNVNLSSTWQLATDSLTNTSSYHLRFLGADLITATAYQPVPLTNGSVTVTNSTNVVVRVPTNGLSMAPWLELSHYLVPPAWVLLTNVPSVIGTNYSWTFLKPYSDEGFLIAITTSANQPAVKLGGLVGLPALTIAASNSTTWGYGAGYACADTNYLYVSVGSNLWKRAALTAW